MTADAAIKLAIAVLGALGTIVAPGAWLLREFVKYLLARIAVLETREATLLANAVQAVEKIGEEQDAQGALIRALAKQEERRQWERDREVRP